MNEEAITHMLDEKGYSYLEEHRGIFVLRGELDNELVREIGACGGSLSATMESELIIYDE